MEENKGSAEVVDRNKEIDNKFIRTENKLKMIEMRLNMAISRLEQDVYVNNMRISGYIVGSVFYNWGSLDSFMRDYIGEDYCKHYTTKDWERHFEIENIKMSNCKYICRS